MHVCHTDTDKTGHTHQQRIINPTHTARTDETSNFEMQKCDAYEVVKQGALEHGESDPVYSCIN